MVAFADEKAWRIIRIHRIYGYPIDPIVMIHYPFIISESSVKVIIIIIIIIS